MPLDPPAGLVVKVGAERATGVHEELAVRAGLQHVGRHAQLVQLREHRLQVRDVDARLVSGEAPSKDHGGENEQDEGGDPPRAEGHATSTADWLSV